MGDSICVYRDRLNEAITLISSMSQPMKLEAVTYWNNVATHLQEIVNHDDGPGRQPQQNPSRSRDYETVNVEVNLPITDANDKLHDNGIGQPIDTSIGSVQDIDVDNILISTQNNRWDEPAQGAIAEEINLLSVTRLDETQPTSSNYSDISAESYQDALLGSLPVLDPCSQQSIMHSSNLSCLLPSNNSSSSSSTDHMIDTLPDLTAEVQQANFRDAGQSLVKSSLNHGLDSSSNLDENILITPCLQYNKAVQEHSYHIGNAVFGQIVSGSHSNQSSLLVTSDHSKIETSATFTGHGQEMRPLQQVQVYSLSTGNTEELSLKVCTDVDHENEQLVDFNQRHLQSTAMKDVAQISSLDMVNYANICRQQTTDAPANIDFSTKSYRIVHTCEACGKSGFSSKGNLKRHLATHTGVKPHQCDYCGSKFGEKKSLTIHLRKHTGEKPFKCDICDKQFKQKEVLESHMTRHNGARKFACIYQDCGKSFKQKSQLATHLKRHRGDRHIECFECKKKFYSSGDLRRHKLVHTGERPYHCHQCSKTFTRKQCLNEHLNRHTGKKPFTCDHCFKAFPDLSSHKKHMKMHADNQNPVIKS